MKLLIHSLTSTVAPLKFRNGLVISSHILLACDYLSMLGLKLNHVLVNMATGHKNGVYYLPM